MSSTSKPTILLIHGCFGTSAIYSRLTPFLQEAQYPVELADFPSTNPSGNPLEITAQKDVEHLRQECLLPLIEKAGKDLILVLHSYAGVIGPAAAVGLSKGDREAEGLQGGVVGLVFVGANITHEGQSLAESAGGILPDWLKLDKPREGLAVMEPLIETLCHDVAKSLEPEVQATAVPQGYKCLLTPLPAPCWAEKGYAGRLAFVRTAEDRINPAWAQDLWIQGTGAKWEVVNMETSHAPMLSQPEQLAQHVLEFGKKFEAI